MILKVLHRFSKFSVLVLLILALGLIYSSVDPEKYSIFPVCPFYWLTGLKCPGCGSQRAIHHLLNFDFPGAFNENPLLVISIPYIIGGLLFDYTRLSEYLPKLRKSLYGTKAIVIVVILVILYWFYRNI